MPDDATTEVDDEGAEAPAPIVHDDIMARLLDYQRRLREGIPSSQAIAPEPAAPAVLVDYVALEATAVAGTATESVEIVDIAAAEASSTEPGDVFEIPTLDPGEPTAPGEGSTQDLKAWMSRVEETLAAVASSIAELRAQLQDTAISADYRLAEIESVLSDVPVKPVNPK